MPPPTAAFSVSLPTGPVVATLPVTVSPLMLSPLVLSTPPPNAPNSQLSAQGADWVTVLLAMVVPVMERWRCGHDAAAAFKATEPR